MRRPADWSLRLRIFLFFALIGLGGGGLVAGAMVLAAGRIGPEAAEPLVLFGGGAALGVVGLAAWVWQLFDENVARPIQLLSGELEARARSRTADGALETAPARYLGQLAPAVEGIAEALASARGGTGAEVARAVDAVISEKAKLEAVLRDLRECVVICNIAGEILLYNAEAQRLLGLGAEIGLGRKLARLITEQPVRHAIERLTNRFTSGRYLTHRDHLSVDLTCATRDGRATLQGRLSLILDAEGARIDGFVATLRDATRAIADQAARDHLLRETLEGLRRPAANLRAAIDVLSGAPEMDGETRGRFLQVIAQEAGQLSRQVDGLAVAYGELRVGGWTMSDISTTALVACATDRLAGGAPALSHAGGRVWLHCDSFTVVEFLAALCRHLAEDRGLERIEIAAEPSGGHVFLDLLWEGAPLPEAVSEGWLGETITPSLANLTGRDVLTHHRTEIWSERLPDGRARLRLPLPPAVEDHEAAPANILPPRPEFYDFGLMNRDVAPDLMERALSGLSFVVFDTETTGLFPSAGDEIVQIAGVRVIGGRVIRGELFDRLVDPGRRIPAASTRVHGITDAMVAGEPGPEAVLPAFHDFAADAVLVAHNAPFDMKFLRLKEGLIGRQFDNPVIDTVLISAHLFGQEADHRLDALAARFGLGFEAGARHTALADALVTADVFVHLVEVLAGRGVATLAEVLAISEEAGAIRRQQTRY